MTLKVTELPDGSSQYVTVDGDMVDHIAYAHYGTHIGTAELLYSANQNLSLNDPVLDNGIVIRLPVFTPPAPPAQIRLWD